MKLYLADDIYDFQSRPTPRPTFILSLPKFEPSPSSIPLPPSIPVSPVFFFFFCKGKIIVEFRANIIKKMKQRSEAGWSSLIRTKFFQIVEYFHYSIRFDDRKQSMEWLVFVNFGTVWRGDGRSKRWEKSDRILRFHRGNEYACA